MPAQPPLKPTAPHQAGEASAHTNRLSNETSPYLLQHAHNPVDWYAWGAEAFTAARQQDKPIFLSIGYSTCYWCHVMERACFENEDIAAIMNKHFICIKVDREERPDVDDIYMAATQMMTGSGGWPMSVFLEPKSLKPFVAGTYFPAEDRPNMPPSFPRVLLQMSDAWTTNRDVVMKQAEQVAAVVKEHLSQTALPVAVGKSDVDKAVTMLMSGFDRTNGGFGRAPKFPTPPHLDFLSGAAVDQKSVKDALLFTLDRMAMGGMYDQVGGGFHRYSTDEKWLVPHFEKMLYDNGQLASTYARAFELTNDPYYAEVVRETLDYVLREMTDKDGGFYSAQDAEVDTREGGNYLWVEQEVRDALTPGGMKDDIEFALNVYGLKRGTNFQDPHHPEGTRKNVLFLSEKPANLAKAMNLPLDDFNLKVVKINQTLLAVRTKRPQPSRDDKVLAGWNGLMIAGMADGGRVLNEKKYKDAASKAAQFVLGKMRDANGGLLRSCRNGQAKIDAFLEDYALMIRGLIALNKSGDRRSLEDAKKLAQIVKSKFWDSSGGGYFDTLDGQSDLFVRVKSSHDGAVPSGNSIMLLNLIDLHELTGHVTYLDDAAATMKSSSSAISENSTGPVLATLALKRFVDGYPKRLDSSSTQGGGAQPKGSGGATVKSGPLEITLDKGEIEVKQGSSAAFNISIKIKPPYHINTNQPGDEFLIPLKIAMTGCEGLKLSVEYPPGVEFKGEIAEGKVYMYKGTVTLPVKVEQTGKFSGRPQISLTYQACTDKECLEPKTVTVGLRVIAQR